MRCLFFIIAFITIFYAGCAEKKVNPDINNQLNTDEIPAQESWNAKVIFSDSGKTTAILYSCHLRVFNEKK